MFAEQRWSLYFECHFTVTIYVTLTYDLCLTLCLTFLFIDLTTHLTFMIIRGEVKVTMTTTVTMVMNRMAIDGTLISRHGSLQQVGVIVTFRM